MLCSLNLLRSGDLQGCSNPQTASMWCVPCAALVPKHRWNLMYHSHILQAYNILLLYFMPGSCISDRYMLHGNNQRATLSFCPQTQWWLAKGMWNLNQGGSLLYFWFTKFWFWLWWIYEVNPHQIQLASLWPEPTLYNKTYNLMPATSSEAQGWCKVKQQPSSSISISSRSCTRLWKLVVPCRLSEVGCRDRPTASWNCIKVAVSIGYFTCYLRPSLWPCFEPDEFTSQLHSLFLNDPH